MWKILLWVSLCPWLLAAVSPALFVSYAQGSTPLARGVMAEQLLALANQSRATARVGQLQWDLALAQAALRHCMRMAIEGSIQHRYEGEDDLTKRAALAGAHFSTIEENIAVGSYVSTIHQGWLDSPAHRANLLNSDVDRVGIAVVANQGVIFAVADYARLVPVMTPSEVEAAVAVLIRARGIGIRHDPTDARAACMMDEGLPNPPPDPRPRYVMRLQAGDLATKLPEELAGMLTSREYRSASVGSCPAREVDGRFTVYRVAVLLY